MDITTQTNERIKRLKHLVDQLGAGGCLQTLEGRLLDLDEEIGRFQEWLEEVNQTEVVHE